MMIRSKAQWLELFKKHEASGLSAAQFCRDEKLCAKHFSKRKQQLGWPSQQLSQSPVKHKSTSDFIKVDIPKTKSHLSLELNGLKLSFDELPPTTWLADFLKALR